MHDEATGPSPSDPRDAEPQDAPTAEPPAAKAGGPPPRQLGGKTPVVPAKGPNPEAATRRDEARAAAREKRVAEQRRRQAAQRRKQVRNGGIVVLAVLVLASLIALAVVNSGHAKAAFTKLSAAAGCTDVQTTDPDSGGKALSHAHLSPDDITKGVMVTYSTSPPTGGTHHPTPLPKGSYSTPFSMNPADNPNIYQAVHSLEHGYVVIWYKGLSSDQVSKLAAFGDQFKVIVSNYPQLPKGVVALTAWGRLQYCDKLDTDQVQKFVDLYKLKTASEPNAA